MSANNRLVADAVALNGKRGKFNSKEMKEQSYSGATGVGAPGFAGKKSSRGLEQSKTLARSPAPMPTRSVLDCGSPLPL